MQNPYTYGMQGEWLTDRMIEMNAQVVEAAGGYRVLSPFVVELSGQDLPCNVELVGEIRDGAFICTSLTLTEATEPITTEVLRSLSMKRLETFALALATQYDDEELADRRRTFEKRNQIASTLRRPKNRITTALLTEVAEIYEAAEAAGEWPIVAIMDRKGVSRSTATTWVGLARSHEPALLPPVKRQSKGKTPKRGTTK